MTAYSLSYDKFQGDISLALGSLLESEDLANVTLAIEGEQLHAHQMVLSISSPYFKTLLTKNPCTHPIIFMKDVKYHIMKQLLRFMYVGHVEIEDDDLPIFIQTAQALQIKWLSNNVNDSKIRMSPETDVTNAETLTLTTTTTNKPTTLKHLLERPGGSSATSPQAKKKQKLSVTGDNIRIEKVQGKYFEAINDNVSETEQSGKPDVGNFDIEEVILPHRVKLEIFDNDGEEELTEVSTLGSEPRFLQVTYPAIAGYEGEPVIATYMETSKTIHMIINNYHFVKHFSSKYYTAWRCTRCRANSRSDRTCKAVMNVMFAEERIYFKNGHNHPPFTNYPHSKIIDTKTFYRTFERT